MGKAVTGINLAGSDRRLFYRVRDACDLEAALGRESIEEALAKRGYLRLVAFLWAGLRRDEEKLKQDDVIRMLDKSDIDYSALWIRVSTALVESGLMPRPDVGGDGDGLDPTSAPSDGITLASPRGANE